MPKQFIVTEKPSVAMDFVKALGGFTRHNGYYENGKYVISWAYGHLVELKSPDEYSPDLKKWSRDTLPIIPNRFIYKIIRGKNKQFSVIKGIIHRSDISSIINAGDPGREGCLLQRLIYQKAGNHKPVQRFWTNNALSADTIKSTLKNLRPSSDFDNLYQSALSRQHADWIVGMSGTRALTIALGDLFSVGRVQTCILSLIVARHKQVVDFKPQKYWLVFADTDKNIRFNWVKCDSDYKNCNNKIKTESDAKEIVALLKNQVALVQKVFNANKSINAPKLFSLTTLQQEANRLFGLSAQETLNIAQSIYEKHYSSYPRTESQYLDETPGTKSSCGKIIKYLTNNGFKTDRISLNAGKKVFDSSKLTDHHAIIPQIPDRKVSLSGNEQKVVNLIMLRFIAAFYPAYKYTQTTVFALSNKQVLRADGKVISDNGWRDIYNFYKKDKTPVLSVRIGENLQLTKVESKAEQTKPQPEYTESYLLKAMTNAYQFITDKQLKKVLKENAGIGTPATRSQIIEVLIKRQYVKRKNKALIPTQKGMFLIKSLNGSKITLPDYTAFWEQRLDEIAQGKETSEHFMAGIVAYINELIEFSDTLKPDSNISTKNKRGKSMGEVLGKCPECGGDVMGNSKAWGCSNWKEEDGNCKFTIWKTIAKKKLTETQAKKILNGEKVAVKGLISKGGSKFGAYLKYDKNQSKVVFDGFL